MSPRAGIAARQRAPLPKEVQTHVAIADALRVGAVAGWAWTHFPAGEARDDVVGAKLKRMGLKPGWPDFLLIHPSGVLFCLELKRGRALLRPEQMDFMMMCRARGIPHAVVRSFDEAVRQLSEWGALRLSVSA